MSPPPGRNTPCRALPPGPDDRDPQFTIFGAADQDSARSAGVFNEAKFDAAVKVWVAERDRLRAAHPELRPVEG
jgi:hypothetical protein